MDETNIDTTLDVPFPRRLMTARQRFPPRPFKWLLLAILLGLGLWYAADSVIYAFVRERSADESGMRTFGSFAHLIVATPLLLLAPLQFSRRLRARYPQWHRWAGTCFLSFSIAAALGAAYLGATFERIGSRTPLVIFAVLWLAFSLAAWVCARRRAFAAHERFVIRSYGVALAFVFVRVLGEFQDSLFFFMTDQALRDTTREWLSFVVPLLAIEAWCSWWPSLVAAVRRGSPPVVARETTAIPAVLE
jgi:hypothetical protein